MVVPVNDSTELCTLCQLPIEKTGFELFTKEGIVKFCCEGCQGVYQMLHEDEIIEPSPK